MIEYCRYASAQALIFQQRFAEALKIAGPILEHQPNSFPAWYQVATAAAHLKADAAAQKNLESASSALVKGLFPLQSLVTLHNPLLSAELREQLLLDLATRYSLNPDTKNARRQPPETFSRGEIPPWNAHLSDSEIIQMAESLIALAWANSLETLQQCPDTCEMPLFSSVSPSGFVRLASECRIHYVNPGELIVGAGVKSDQLYFIVYGTVQRHMNVGHGKQIRHTLFENDLFGDESLLTGNGESADIFATEPCTLLQIPAATLIQTAESEPEMPRFLVQHYQQKTLKLLLMENPILTVSPATDREKILKQMTAVVAQGDDSIFPSTSFAHQRIAGGNFIGEDDCIMIFSGGICEKEKFRDTGNTQGDGSGTVFKRGDWIDMAKWQKRATGNTSLVALENTVALKLSRNEFRAIIAAYPKSVEAMYPLQKGN